MSSLLCKETGNTHTFVIVALHIPFLNFGNCNTNMCPCLLLISMFVLLVYVFNICLYLDFHAHISFVCICMHNSNTCFLFMEDEWPFIYLTMDYSISSMFPKSTHETFSQKLYQTFKSHKRFIKPKLSRTDFAIAHYAGEVS